MIKMEPSELRSLASYLTDLSGNISEEVTAMNNRIENDTQEWDGESKQSYFEGFEEIKPTLTQTFPAVITDLANKLTYAADQIETADTNISSSFKG